MPKKKKEKPDVWEKQRAKYLKKHKDCQRCFYNGGIKTPATNAWFITSKDRGGVCDDFNTVSLCDDCCSIWNNHIGILT